MFLVFKIRFGYLKFTIDFIRCWCYYCIRTYVRNREKIENY